MPKKKPDEQPGEPQARELPAGVKLFRILEGHKDIVYSVAFDPTGRMLASGGNDKTAKLWEVASGNLLRTLEGHTDNVDAIVFSVDGRLLTSKSRDSTVRLCTAWNSG